MPLFVQSLENLLFWSNFYFFTAKFFHPQHVDFFCIYHGKCRKNQHAADETTAVIFRIEDISEAFQAIKAQVGF